MKLEVVNLRVQRLIVAHGAVLEMRIEQHSVVIYVNNAETGRISLRALQSANSPETTPVYMLEQASLQAPHQALLPQVVQAAITMFSRYTGARIRVAKPLQASLATQVHPRVQTDGDQ